jgi:hypothetical protein
MYGQLIIFSLDDSHIVSREVLLTFVLEDGKQLEI